MIDKTALNSEIQDYIKEFLKYNNLSNTIEVLDAEYKTIQVINQTLKIFFIQKKVSNKMKKNQD